MNFKSIAIALTAVFFASGTGAFAWGYGNNLGYAYPYSGFGYGGLGYGGLGYGGVISQSAILDGTDLGYGGATVLTQPALIGSDLSGCCSNPVVLESPGTVCVRRHRGLFGGLFGGLFHRHRRCEIGFIPVPVQTYSAVVEQPACIEQPAVCEPQCQTLHDTTTTTTTTTIRRTPAQYRVICRKAQPRVIKHHVCRRLRCHWVCRRVCTDP